MEAGSVSEKCINVFAAHDGHYYELNPSFDESTVKLLHSLCYIRRFYFGASVVWQAKRCKTPNKRKPKPDPGTKCAEGLTHAAGDHILPHLHARWEHQLCLE